MSDEEDVGDHNADDENNADGNGVKISRENILVEPKTKTKTKTRRHRRRS